MLESKEKTPKIKIDQVVENSKSSIKHVPYKK